METQNETKAPETAPVATQEQVQATTQSDDATKLPNGYTHGDVRRLAKDSRSFPDLFERLGYGYRPSQPIRQKYETILGTAETARLKAGRRS